MWSDPGLLGACLVVAILIALPAALAGRRRRLSRELGEVANALIEFAVAVRRAGQQLRVDESLLARARRLRIPEWISFEFAQAIPKPDPELLADSAQRLGLRLKRRVAFERKMLARTAAGRWRGSIAAAAPAAALLVLGAADILLPAPVRKDARSPHRAAPGVSRAHPAARPRSTPRSLQ
jgi:hypothetical protein